MVTDSFYETSLITSPISAHNISPTNASVTLQEKIHSQASTQTPAQEDERKSKMSTRIINETTLRIYFTKDPEISSLAHPEVLATSISETITATN